MSLFHEDMVNFEVNGHIKWLYGAALQIQRLKVLINQIIVRFELQMSPPESGILAIRPLEHPYFF